VLENQLRLDGAPGVDFQIDGKILFITLLVSLLTGVLFGILPAVFASRTDVNAALKSQTRGSTSGRSQHRFRHALIIGEVALALVLLGGAAIMNRGFAKLLERATGWDIDRVLVGAVFISEVRFDVGEKRLDIYRKLENRLAAIPGVEHAALATSVPLFNYTSERPVFIDAPAAPGAAQNPVASHVMITTDYFSAMGIPLLEGRAFAPDVKPDSPRYTVVNESLARLFWPGESAIGKRLGAIENGAPGWLEVIGVVRDVEPAANIGHPPTRLTVYRPLVQEPWSFVHVVVRSRNPGALIESVRRAIAEVDPDMPADQLSTVDQFVHRNQHNLRVVGQLLVGFAALGLVLAAVGLYGVISNLVAQRTSEFGIRLALGAQPRDILRHVLSGGLRLTAMGLALGLLGTVGLGVFLASVMPRLVSSDPVALALVSGVLLAVALVACWFPAWRATRVNPLDALRAE
ncbi:MAG TPA: FtsX-like permease family protein, partial [Opitutus sp.]|nr:FtsX-like permease family protein [Opitutus sp.]